MVKTRGKFLQIGLLAIICLATLSGYGQDVEERYYIQVSASKAFVEPEVFQERLGLTLPVGYLREQEWYKYYVGPFKTFAAAFSQMKDHRIDGFVTRYPQLPVDSLREALVQTDLISPEDLSQGVEPPADSVLFVRRLLQKLPLKCPVKQSHIRDRFVLVPAWSFLSDPDNTGTFTDPRDSTSYDWVRLGSQVWMTENMRYQTAGSRIPAIDSLLPPDYGFLYTHYSARSACPDGWHLPSDAEWMVFERFLGLQDVGLRSIGTRPSGHLGLTLKSGSRWHSKGNGVDRYGFSVLPSGFVNASGESKDLHERAFFWTDTQALVGIWIRSFSSESYGVIRTLSSPNKFISVRCLKDLDLQ